MESPSNYSPWNKPTSQPLSRTASAVNGLNTPPSRYVSPNPFNGSTSALRYNIRPGGVSGGTDFFEPGSTNPPGLGAPSRGTELSHEEIARRHRVFQSSQQTQNGFVLDLMQEIVRLRAESGTGRNVSDGVYDLLDQAVADKKDLADQLLRAQENQRLAEECLRRSRACVESDRESDRAAMVYAMLFDDNLVAKGESGGKEAAERLHSSVQQYLSEEISRVPKDCRIIARVYSNTKGLAETYYHAALVDTPSKFEDFSRAFTTQHTLFDWIDVGSGRDQKDVKIREMFKLHLTDPHCRHILLGCVNEAGIDLQSLYDQNLIRFNAFTVLEAVPARKSSGSVRYRTTKLNDLFRSQITTPWHAMKEPSRYPTPPVSLPGSEAPMSRTNSASDIQEDARRQSPPPPVPVITSSKYPTPLTWASTVKRSTSAFIEGEVKHSSISTPSSADDIPRNRKNQRIDPLIKHDKDEVERVKKMKLCNVHFLRGECPYGEQCTHVHRAKPTTTELKYLSLVARMAPCMHGSWCEDAKCIYGHICPAPEGRRGELCIFAGQCRFPEELHKIDRVPVKTKKI
ncbi:hypothetical protein FH972_022809 [Carpinus fangiana]|uniref:C3H1-type domain-containing protein n=1 Tax=Carpinus fangiana TaxID=176857 RepID=A0A5N6KTQ0_9ROSI|nr:hypothetical protein FH972_022809 [Carpinus fangiana]